ncbi:MAG: bi-domain-containing oxidoreductase [Chitinophagaceae bacterium]
MKQIIQNLNSGETSVIEVPMPVPGPGQVVVRNTRSLVSSGTERMLLDFGKAGWLGKVRQQPERVQEVLRKVRTDGWIATLDAVQNKINKEIPLGNSSVGVVVALGSEVAGLKLGDRVATNGAHAEVVCVSRNLCALVPDSVSDNDAAFTVIGAIALQGIRLINPAFGEHVVVYGLGLIGQLAVQLLKANGCRVTGVDPDTQRCALARKWGIAVVCNADGSRAASFVKSLNDNQEADAVLITASAKDDEILSDSADMCRKRGRIVLTGVINTQFARNDFYKKELSFQVSSAYGPGRYDYEYESGTTDYPEAFVRWTARRNMEAVLQAMAAGQLLPSETDVVIRPFSEYKEVYDALGSSAGLATLFAYPEEVSLRDIVTYPSSRTGAGKAIAVIGAGNFCAKVILPALQKHQLRVEIIASEHGLSAAQNAKKFGIAAATAHSRHVFEHEKVDTVFIATPHHTHAALVIESLQAGKNVFVEKPLAINSEELDAITAAYRKADKVLDIGFNRRHAPYAVQAKRLMGDGVRNISITVNAGAIAAGNWLSDKAASGGRLIGEVCHFIDLAAFFAGAKVHSVCAQTSSSDEENVSLLLRMDNGCCAVINYFTNGNPAYGKERIELYGSGKTIVIDNWKSMKAYGFKRAPSFAAGQDKGHAAQFAAIAERIKKGGIALIPFESIYNTSSTALAALESLRDGCWKSVR